MRDTDRTARSGMMKFVAITFGIAIAVAAVYFLFLTPGGAILAVCYRLGEPMMEDRKRAPRLVFRRLQILSLKKKRN